MGRCVFYVQVFSACSVGSTGEETDGLLWACGYFSYSVQFTCDTVGLLWVGVIYHGSMGEETAGLLWVGPSSHSSKGGETVGLLRVDGSSNGSVRSASETADLLWVASLLVVLQVLQVNKRLVFCR